MVEFDGMGKAISLEEKPQNPKSIMRCLGYIFMMNKQVAGQGFKTISSWRVEITDLNRVYLEAGELSVDDGGRECCLVGYRES